MNISRPHPTQGYTASLCHVANANECNRFECLANVQRSRSLLHGDIGLPTQHRRWQIWPLPTARCFSLSTSTFRIHLLSFSPSAFAYQSCEFEVELFPFEWLGSRKTKWFSINWIRRFGVAVTVRDRPEIALHLYVGCHKYINTIPKDVQMVGYPDAIVTHS